LANTVHAKRLKQGVAKWNAWREDKGEEHRNRLNEAVAQWWRKFQKKDYRKQLRSLIRDGMDQSVVDLSGMNLHRVDLRGADLHAANLTGADLSGANLGFANLLGANLSRSNLNSANLGFAQLLSADLSGANLSGYAMLNHTLLTGANLSDANLSDAALLQANLTSTQLRSANLTNTSLMDTVFANVDLTDVIGLETCRHKGPSIVDHRTLQKSGRLPLTFLRGVGLPDRLIEYLPSLFDRAIQYYSCFISYSAKDQEFADRIHADLQNNGVRCWFASHDMPIGGKILDEIDVAIRLRDRVLLILSEHSIESDWVEDEVTKGFEEERKRGQIVLFPVRLDDVVMATNEPWAAKLRTRLIGDFRSWKEHDAYKQSFERVVRDLTLPPKVL
jgi:uncharacterized protein YjbI with pentapeptide repeats